ncbi:MAG: hypothetical protein A2452_03090 [Candidatus Firestonebacteria bacterium RIFOXYC2_FULL_39_67]|nr:MAG: hypothetical protein A2536_02505 [Candidatus Firestonebacteria bacterium RIFOXYD2_FULL_39_29]OGF55437.1 MAG: hypothetical protein A2452_03090 [Candidatus Firestonebacteria bacterium RIFOXYC2_FULL_39_67]OGF56039.1 MAG: hypothetical protein A2497_07740 [Candidatus Firestonebacteria bacterium RifOxyC12_full_39_7]
MNYFLSASFMLFLALIFLAVNVFLMDIRPKLKYVFCCYIIIAALTMLFRIYASFPLDKISERGLWFWYSFTTFVNSFLPSMTLHFILVISGRGQKYNNKILSVSFGLSLLFGFVSLHKDTLISGFSLSEFGYVQVRSVSRWMVAYGVFSSLALFTAIVLCIDWYRNAKSELEKKQAKFLTAGNTLIFLSGYIIYACLGGGSFKYNHFMGTVLQTLILSVYSLAVFRYRLLDTRDIAAKNIIKNMSEIFILSDNKDDSLVEVNQAAVKILGYPQQELLKKKLKDIVFINANMLECTICGYESKENISGQCEGYLKTSSGKRIPVEFNVSCVRVEKIGFSGAVIVASDVSEILGYIERQKEKNREMSSTFAELKKKRDFMERFQKITGKRDDQKQKLLKELENIKAESVKARLHGDV